MDIKDIRAEQSRLIHLGQRIHIRDDTDMGRQPNAKLARSATSFTVSSSEENSGPPEARASVSN